MNKKIKEKIRAHKEILIGLGALIIVAAISVLIVGLKIDDQVHDVVGDVIEFQTARHPLTGQILDDEIDELPQVFGVMVENSADAWPLSGLEDAFLVIEAPVEGSIPRFIAFYSADSEAEKIGPVRSARSYYIDWNDELEAIYAHVGGSPEALDLIKYDYDTYDLNQFWYDDYFYRENRTRYAPHNVYTDIGLLNQAFEDVFNLDEPKYDIWRFKNDAPVEDPISIEIDWADGSTYDVGWEYNEQTNSYFRYQGFYPMNMEDDDYIEVNNIAVIATDIRIIDNEGRKSVVTEGQGDALIIQDGEVYLAIWKKQDRNDRLKFYTSDGFEISFNAGNTWIEIISNLSQVSIID